MTEEEFTNVYKKYVDKIYILCFSFMKNKADAEDCVQETFIKFLKNNDLFDSDEHLKAWLIVTASNTCKTELKRKSSKETVDIDDLQLPDNLKKNDNSGIIDSVMKLPPKYKTVIYMFYYEGYKINEISKILKKKESTIKSLLKRGREILKSNLKGWESNG